MWPQATSDQGRQGARRRSAEIVEATRDVFKFDNGLMLWAGNKLLRVVSRDQSMHVDADMGVHIGVLSL